MVSHPTEVFASSLREGHRRLNRSWLDLGATGCLGGLSIVIGSTTADTASGLLRSGGMAPTQAHLIGALLFPLGFFVLVQIRAELLTENFLVPVNAVLDGLARPVKLLRLWAGSAVANVGAAIAVTWVAAIPSVFPPGAHREFIEVAEQKMSQPLGALFASAALAGAVITVMTLAMLRESPGGWVVVFAAGYILNAAGLQHVIVDSVDVWLGIWAGAPIAAGDWFVRNFLPCLLMNTVGGIGLATIPHYLQVYHERGEVVQDVREEVGAAPPRRRF
jgi:formate/nitrite transporter FocA (FNT family)